MYTFAGRPVDTNNVDRVSFAGGVIKTIAKSVKHTNLFDPQKVSDLVPDEALRKYRMAEEIFRRGREKKISITVPDPTDPDMHKEIIRRQTGFVRPEDLTRMRQFERPDDYDDLSDDELDDYLPYTRQVSIQPPSVTSYKTTIGLGRPDRKDKKDPIPEKSQQMLHEKIGEEIEKRQMSEQFDIPTKADASATVPRIIDVPGQQQRIAREKKGERPLSEKQQKNTLFLLTYSPEKHINLTTLGDDPREIYLRRRQSITMHMGRPQDQHKSIDHILGLQHGKGVYRKISTDYVKTIDQIEQKEQTSLRSLEYAKHRPAISVKEYQKQNREYNESLQISKLSKVKQGKGKD